MAADILSDILFLFPVILLVVIWIIFYRFMKKGPQQDMIELMKEQMALLEKQTAATLLMAENTGRIAEALEKTKAGD